MTDDPHMPGSPDPLIGRCGAKLSDGSGRHCQQARGWQTDHPGFGNCKWHGGASPNGRISAQREQAAAALLKLGEPIDVDPVEALVFKLHEAFGHAAWLRQELERQTALYGPDHLGDARPHVLWTMWGQERDRAAKLAELCHKAGISEREIHLAESLGQLVASGFTKLLESAELGLSAGQQQAGKVLAGQILRELTAASTVDDL